jgi:hypothetical protein
MPPKAEVTKAVVAEVREAIVVEVAATTGEEGVFAETVTAKTAVTTETSAAVAAMGHRGAGRHCCGTQDDGRRDRNQAGLPPHASLSFLPSSDTSMAAFLETLRIDGRRHQGVHCRSGFSLPAAKRTT